MLLKLKTKVYLVLFIALNACRIYSRSCMISFTQANKFLPLFGNALMVEGGREGRGGGLVREANIGGILCVILGHCMCSN